MSKTCLVCFTDGRPGVLLRTLKSFKQNLITVIGEGYNFDHSIISDDSGEPDYSAALKAFGGFTVLDSHKNRIGYTRSIIRTWALIPKDVDYIFHLEDDFTLDRPVLIDEMVYILENNDYLAQIALKRHPVNTSERIAGDILLQRPEDFTQRSLELEPTQKKVFWCEHRSWFTCNPCLYPRWVVDIGWPNCRSSEGNFKYSLFGSGPEIRSSYFGKINDTPLVTHISYMRLGWGY